jgi:hypothetical protein
MIRLEMTAVDKVTGLDGDGNNTVEIHRQVLFLQEWQHGDGPDVGAVIALVNDLLRPVCQCGHRKQLHGSSAHSARCAAAGCDCMGFKDPVVVARERAAARQLELEKRLSTLQAMEVVQAKQLITANKRASDHNLEARRARESLVRAQAKARKLARGSAPKKRPRG